MRAVRTGAIALVCAALAGWSAAQSPAVPSSVPKPASSPSGQPEAGKATGVWLRLDGLDTSAASAAITSVLGPGAAKGGKAPVIIEIGSMPVWRADVLRDVLLGMKEATSAVHVHVTDTGSGGKKGVSRAVMLMCLGATTWSCSPAVLGEGDVVKFDDEGRSREYAVEKIDWSLVEGDVRDVVARAWEVKGGAAGRSDLLVYSKQRWWGVEPRKPKDGWELRAGEKPEVEGVRVHDLGEAGATVPMSALLPEGAMPSKMATVAAVAKSLGIRVGKDADHRGPANLSAQFVQVGSRMESVKASLDGVERRLKSAEDGERRNVRTDVERAKKDLVAIEKTIGEIEERLASTPELTRMVPPGKADVASKPSTQPARWRSAVQSLKDRSSKAGVKAGELLR